MVKFIHCADIHLGKIQSNLEQRFLDFGVAFQRVVDEALRREVDFVVIAGDLFDKRNINARTLEQAVRILDPLKVAGIPVIAIEGNHDKAFLRDKESWMSFLANRGYIVLLSPRFEGGKLLIEPYDTGTCSGCYIDLAENVRVYGLGYLGRAAADKLKELAEHLPVEMTNILLLHAMVGRMGGEMIGSIPKGDVACLKGKVSYLALGHGHNRYVVEPVLSLVENVSQEPEAALELPGDEREVSFVATRESLQISLFNQVDEELAAVEVAENKDVSGCLSDDGVPDGIGEPGEEPFATEHVFPEADDYSRSWGHNPGSIEHCRLEEADHNHGFYYVEMEGKELTWVEHIPSSQRSARIIAVDISGSADPEAAYAQITAAVGLETAGLTNPLVRLVIKGETRFDILEVDEAWIRERVEEICSPLILEIDMRANLPQYSLPVEAELLDRQSIEREILRKKVEDRAQWRHLGDDLVNLILELKDDVINGVPPEEVASKVLQMAGGTHENS